MMSSVVKQVNQVKASLRGMASTPMIGGGQQTVQQLSAINAKALDVTSTFRHLSRYQREALTPIRMVSSGIVDQEIRFRNLNATMAVSSAVARDQIVMQRALGNTVSMTSARLGVMGGILSSVGANLVKTGKNMQWTGRQMMVGFTLPLALMGRALSTAATDVDKQLTRIVKVYNFAGEQSTAAVQRLRDESMQTAQTIAEQFGIAAQSTLELTATFAQMGKRGPELQQLTQMTSQIQLLGEVEAPEAINLTRTVMDGLNLSAEETATTLQRLNAVENNTVLTLQDMSSEIPDLVGVMKSLNLPLEQAVAYLAAMKEAGLNVNEAQTALRNSITRLTKPTSIAVEHFKTLGINLDSLFADAGNATEMMYNLSDAIHGIADPRERTRALAYLFDTRQAARMMVLLSAIREEARGTGAYAEALEQMGLDAADAQRLAMEETRAVAESLSGQVNRVKESIRIMAASLGATLMPKIIMFMQVIENIVGGIDRLPDFAKNILGISGAFLVVVGPIVMVTGLLKTLFGTITGVVGSIAKAASRFHLLSGAMFNTRMSNQQFGQSATQAGTQLDTSLTPALNKATAASRVLSAEQAKLRGQMVMPAPPGAVGGAAGFGAVPAPPLARRSLKDLANKTKEIGRQAAATSGMFLLMAGSIGRASTEAGTLSRTFANVAIGAGGLLTILPMLTNPITAMLAGLMAVVGAFVLIKSHVKDLREANLNPIEGAEGIAETLNITLQEGEVVLDEYGNRVESTADKVERLKEEQAGMVDELKRIREEEGDAAVRDKIIQIGYELQQRGASPEQIHDSIEVITESLGPIPIDVKVEWENAEAVAEARLKSLRSVMEQSLDWNGPENDRRTFIERWFGPMIGDPELPAGVLENFRDMGRSLAQALTDGSIESMQEGIEPMAKAIRERNKAIQERVEQDHLGLRDLGVLARSVEVDEESFNMSRWRDFMGLNEMMVRQFDTGTETIVRNIRAQVQAHDELIAGLEEEIGVSGSLANVRIGLGNLTQELAKAGVPAAQIQQEYNRRVAEATRLAGELSEEQKQLILANTYEANGRQDLADAIRDTSVEVEGLGEEVEDLNSAMSDTQKQRFGQAVSGMRSELQSIQQEWVGAILEGFDEETKAANDAADDQFKQREKALDDQFEQQEKAFDARWKATEKAFDAEWDQRERAFEKQQEQREEALEAEHDAIIEAAEDRWDARIEAAEDRADEELEVEEKAWDARIEAAEERNKQQQEQIKEATDARVDAIEQELKAEETIEKNRQAMFDAEKSRIAQQARANQQLINLRFALASGDLQQAAIIQEQAAADQWTQAMEVAAQQQAAAADRVKQSRQTEIERIKEEGDTRVEQVKRLGDAEQERMRQEKELRIEALRETKEVMAERLRAERENAIERLNIEKKLAQDRMAEQHEAEQRTLQMRRETAQESMQLRRDEEREAMQLRHDNAAEAMRLEREQNQRRYEESRANARAIEEARLQELILTAPKNEEEFARMQQEFLAEATRIIQVRSRRDRVAGHISASHWRKAVEDNRAVIEEDVAWEKMGENVGDRMVRGMLGMSMIEFRHWAETGKFHTEDMILGERRAAAGRVLNDRALPGDRERLEARHRGGMAGSGVGSNRLGRSGPLYADEIPTVLQRGEYVFDKKTTSRLGPEFLASLQQQKKAPISTPYMHSGGMRESMSALIAGSMEQGIRRMLREGVTKRNQMNLEEGNYTNFVESEELGIKAPEIPTFEWGGGALPGLDAAQTAIAGQIWEIGNQLKASGKMLTAAFMAALVESNMRNINFGDRDSVGIFQQRPSMGWGTVSQIMNPDFAIRSFFQGRGGNRGALDYRSHTGTPGQLAQAVQRSAFPGRYDERAPIVAQIMAALQGGGAGGPAGAVADWPGGFPPRRWATASANTLAAQRFIAQNWPSTRNGGDLGLGRGVAASDHSWGKALDIYPGTRPQQYANPAQAAEGWSLANWFLNNPNKFGTKYAIWQKKIKSVGGALREYTRYGSNPGPVLGHYDHVHLSFKHLGGLIEDMNDKFQTFNDKMRVEGIADRGGIPSLFAGGRVKFDNTLANLHRGETVLTSKLTDKLERGVSNIDSGVSNQYNININVEGGVTEIDVHGLARQVRTEIQKLDSRSGHTRRI